MRLALEPGVFVRTDRLVEDLWAADAVDHPPQHPAIEGRPVAPGARGSERRSSAVTAATSSRSTRRRSTRSRCWATPTPHRGCSTRATTAAPPTSSASTLAMYRGEVLPAAGDADWVTPHRARLDEARTKLVETQFSARLRLGDVGDVIGELEAAVAAHPFQEGLWELLDHRAVPGRAPSRRAGDVPAGPDAAGRRARARPRTAAPAARATDPASTTRHSAPRPVRRVDRRRGTCRRCRSSWSGASRRWRRCPTCSPRKRLVEIVGPGGIGKTAVAIATGRAARPVASGVQVPGGVWLARLESATTRRRSRRHVDRGAERHRRRGRAVRAAQGRAGVGDPRQLRTRRRRGRGARGPPARRRSRAPHPVHQPGPPRRRR